MIPRSACLLSVVAFAIPAFSQQEDLLARLPAAHDPLASMSAAQQEAWMAAQGPDGRPNWPAAWLPAVNARFYALIDAGVIPQEYRFDSPAAVSRFVKEFYHDWGDGQANTQWQARLLEVVASGRCAEGETANALAASMLHLHAQGIGLTSAGQLWMLSRALRSIPAPAYPELDSVADELLVEAANWALASDQPHMLDMIQKEQQRVAADPSTEAASSDEVEALFSTEDRSIDAAALRALLAQSQLSDAQEDLRSILRRLRAVSMVLKRTSPRDGDVVRPIEAWLLKLAETSRWRENTKFVRAWSRCASALDNQASPAFRSRVELLAADASPASWQKALQAVARQLHSRDGKK